MSTVPRLSALSSLMLALLLAAACTQTGTSGPNNQAAAQVEQVQAETAEAEAAVAQAETALDKGDFQTAFEAAQNALDSVQRSEILLESAANSHGEATVDYEANASRLRAVENQAQSVVETLMPPVAAAAPPPPPPMSPDIQMLDLGVHLYDTARGPGRDYGYYAYVAFPSGAQSTCAQRRYVVRHALDILSDIASLPTKLDIEGQNHLLAALMFPIDPAFRDSIPSIVADKDEDLLLKAYNYPYARQFIRDLGLDDQGVYLLAYPVPFEYLDDAPNPDHLGLIDLTGANEERVAKAIKYLRERATINTYSFQQSPDRLAVAMVDLFESVGSFLASFGATEAQASDVSCP
ncbi:MAG: hypothetical protein R8L07_05500 [Alphaproteobacteria bacterium]|nr:hypothetical protein [Alphaproteobacteria bacterium]